MNEKNEILYGLTSDAMFKLILGSENNKDLTAWVFNHVQTKYCIKPQDIIFMDKEERIAANFQGGEMDVRFRVKDELYVDMEVQMYVASEYETMERLDTYLSMLKLSSLLKGDNYRKRNTIVIAFCNEKLVKNSKECILVKQEFLGEQEVLTNHNIVA